MKLIIFGASGGTGRLVTEMALAQGHDVTAFVRSPEKLNIDNPKLTVVKGDIMDAEAVKNAVAGHDAAMALLNTIEPAQFAMFEQGAKNIVEGLKAQGVKLFSWTSSFGVPDGFERDPYYEENFRQGQLKDVYAEGRKAEAIVTESGLDWILVRPPMLLDMPPTGNYRIVDTPPLDMRMISRQDLAEFMLKSIQDPKYIHTGMFVGL